MKNKPRNHSDEAIELMLKSTLRPRKVDWQIDREILESMLLQDDKVVRKRRWSGVLRYGWISTLGMAATLVIAFTYFAQTGSDPMNEDTPQGGIEVSPIQFRPNQALHASNGIRYRAVGAKNRLIDAKDNGWSRVDEDSVTRELKYEYLDTVDLVNEEDGSVMRVEVPRHEIVNVTYQVI